jgi:hypothetical protein
MHLCFHPLAGKRFTGGLLDRRHTQSGFQATNRRNPAVIMETSDKIIKIRA